MIKEQKLTEKVSDETRQEQCETTPETPSNEQCQLITKNKRGRPKKLRGKRPGC